MTTKPVVFSLLLSVSLALLLTGTALAQKATEDVLYLKNGWILRGKIISSAADRHVRIRTYDRNEFEFRRGEIDSVAQEPIKIDRDLNIRYKRRGFSHYTELGALAARNTSSGTNTSAFSFQTVNGYKFGQLFYLGAGIGIDLYATQSVLPIFGSIRGDLVDHGNIIPFYFLDAGYGINITGTDENLTTPTTYSGGPLFAAGIGTKVIFNNSTGFLISIGYRSQKTSIEQDFGSSRTKEDVTFERIAIRAGFTF